MEISIVKVKNLWSSFYEEEKQQRRELLIDIIGQYLNLEIQRV
jgi:muramidase (phage lysozyme)